MYDVSGSDSKAEWVEIQNTGDTAVDISKWKFNDGSNHVLNAPPKNGSTGTTVIGPGEYLILAADAATFSASHTVGVSVIDTVMSLPNDKGTLTLFNASSTVEDKISYSSSKGASGTGESLQKVQGKFIAAIATPGAANSSVKIAKTAPKLSPEKTTTTKKVAKAGPEILDGTSTIDVGFTEVQDQPASPQVAAAVVPLGEKSNSLMPWLFGVLSLGVAGAGAVFVSKQKKKGEWDIEEIT